MINPSSALAVINISTYPAGLCPCLKRMRFSVSVSISSFLYPPSRPRAIRNCENPLRPEEQLKASSGGATYNGNNNQKPNPEFNTEFGDEDSAPAPPSTRNFSINLGQLDLTPFSQRLRKLHLTSAPFSVTLLPHNLEPPASLPHQWAPCLSPSS